MGNGLAAWAMPRPLERELPMGKLSLSALMSQQTHEMCACESKRPVYHIGHDLANWQTSDQQSCSWLQCQVGASTEF